MLRIFYNFSKKYTICCILLLKIRPTLNLCDFADSIANATDPNIKTTA